ncbi:MAG: site-2 protease family protein [Actinomycetia bacterium]|nr:site-2 protease family protein [Actinomycetes bacterium]
MSDLAGIVAFVVLLLLSVMVHEWGHFATARRFGMKVTEFFVGFGPRLWSVRRGETEYGVKAVPAGGYVKITGMTDLEPVAPEDEPRAFYRAPARQRAVVLAAGSAMHFAIGLALLLFVFMALGSPVLGTRLAEVTSCVPATAGAECAPGDPQSPAAAAGLQSGDTVVAVNGTPVEDWAGLTEPIRASAGTPMTFTVERDGQQQEVTVVPATVERTDPTTGEPVTVGYVGISPQVTMDRAGPVEAIGSTLRGTWAILVGTAQALAQLPEKVVDLVRTLAGDQERDPNGLVGIVGAADISGQLASGDLPPAARVGDVLLLVASFNLFVGVFNLLPLLPLDGGHLAVLGYEQLRNWWARRRGRPEPGRVDMTRLMPLAYVVFVFFVGLTLLLVAADVLKPVQL